VTASVNYASGIAAGEWRHGHMTAPKKARQHNRIRQLVIDIQLAPATITAIVELIRVMTH
jgi:hypothetical protein